MLQQIANLNVQMLKLDHETLVNKKLKREIDIAKKHEEETLERKRTMIEQSRKQALEIEK